MKFHSILVVTLMGVSKYATADDNINMLRGILPHLKKMKDDVVNVLADDKDEGGIAIVDRPIYSPLKVVPMECMLVALPV